MSDDYTKYEKHYSEDGFWKKLGKYALKAGASLVEKALQLYYVMKDPNAPVLAKSTAAAALGYFIFPIDVVPDIVPIAGYSDDVGVVASALLAIAAYITPEIKEMAQRKMGEWFSR